jgi:hypothetical protein
MKIITKNIFGYHIKIYEAPRLWTVYTLKWTILGILGYTVYQRWPIFALRHLKHKTVDNIGTNKDILMKFVVDDDHDCGIEWWWKSCDNFYLLFPFYFLQFYFLQFSLLTDLEKNPGAFPGSRIRFPCLAYSDPKQYILKPKFTFF